MEMDADTELDMDLDQTPGQASDEATGQASDEAIAQAIGALGRGELVCVITETSYGLAADIHNPAALAALAVLKGRDAASPMGLIAADMAQARALARSWPAAADELAARFWPGPLTLVVPAAAGLAKEIVGPGGVGVRVSSHPVPVALARGLGRPITATSANPAGQPPAMDIAQARGYFGDRVHYLDSGPAPGQRPSTLVAITAPGEHGERGIVQVLRPGPIDIMVKTP